MTAVAIALLYMGGLFVAYAFMAINPRYDD